MAGAVWPGTAKEEGIDTVDVVTAPPDEAAKSKVEEAKEEARAAYEVTEAVADGPWAAMGVTLNCGPVVAAPPVMSPDMCPLIP